ncbi:MAG: hypothetical protein ACOYZ7_14640 [Chloroflexota bacterium]
MTLKRTCGALLLALAIGAGGIGLLLLNAHLSPPASAAGPAAALPQNEAAEIWAAADNPDPPTETVKLIFVHHSCGENWLADGDGGLGIALRDNHYFVSDTNYGWGPDSIGDHTDIGYWYNWFVGPDRDTYTAALYAESGQNASYSRLSTDPGGENEIILFKSCYPNSHLGGDPDDPPVSGSNPLRGQDAWSEYHTVANAKGIYNDLLAYFATQPDRLFVVVTAPPLMQSETDAAHAANARAFNDWLVNDWLDGYAHDNVAVFDFYNVLTSNGGDADTNDAGAESGNHHRWWDSAVQHVQTVSSNYSAYPGGSGGGSHPTAAGNQKATAEFVPLLNVYYHRWQASSVFTPTDWVYLPLILKQWSAPAPSSGDLVQPADLTYLGAFRLPGGDDPPQTFAYGGNAMTFNPDGDPANSDAYPGALFITGHDRIAYGGLPNGDQVAEVNIPAPSVAGNPADLPQAAFLQGFSDVTAGYFTNLEEIPKVGIQYLNHADTGPLLHLCWGQHLQPPDEPSHAWFSADLSAPNLQGVWFIGDQNLYSTNGYLFDIPTAWADAHAQGRYLATGRMRDGGQGGMGPTLFAYRPWETGGAAPASGARLSETTLLLYENAYNTDEITRCLDGYQHPDEWEGGAWLTTPSGKSAVLFAGTKSNGAKYWYGYIHPDGPQYPCVDAEVTDFTTCRLADGSACPPEDFSGCCEEGADCVSYRGWWPTRFDAQLILYDPADLARVAAGEIESWQPQPYAVIDIDEHLYLEPPVWDEISLGWGDQRRARIGAAAYDRQNGLLYVLELYADGAKPVVHVWQVD